MSLVGGGIMPTGPPPPGGGGGPVFLCPQILYSYLQGL